MRPLFFVLLGLVLIVPAVRVQAAESATEETVDLSGVHKVAVLPVVIKLEETRRSSRSGARRESRTAAREEAEKEALAVARVAGDEFRHTFTIFLKNTGYQVLDTAEVDRAIGAPEPGKELDPVAAGRAAEADAVFVIVVKKAENEVGGFSSGTTLKVLVNMTVVATKEVAWEIEEDETIRSGVLPGGTQVVEIVGALNTDDSQRRRDLRRVATGLSRKLVLTLPDPHRNLDVVVMPPKITSATLTGTPPFGPQQPLLVEMTGDAAMRASFDLARADGTLVYADLPMNEKEPGHYSGLYRPILDDPLGGTAQARVRLAAETGLTARQWVGGGSEPMRVTLDSLYVAPASRGGFRSPSDSKGTQIDFAPGWMACQPRTLAILPFTGKEEGALLLRQTLFGGLLSSQFRLIDNLAVDRTLKRIGKPLSGPYAPEDIQAISDALGADLVMTGDVTKWDRTYLAVQSYISTELKLVVYDGDKGAVVARIEDKKSKSKGLLGIPTGIGSAVIAPISGMSKGFLYRAAFDLSESIAGALSCVPAMDAAASSTAIKSLKYAGPVATKLVPGDTLEITLEARTGGQAYFSVGEAWSFLPMREVTPGVYSGYYQVRVGDYLHNALVEAVYVGEGWKRSLKIMEAPALSTATATQ